MSYERLTEKDRLWELEESWQYSQEPSYEEIEEVYHRLAELEDNIDNGILIEFPCKIGDTVYWCNDSQIFEEKVYGFSFDTDGLGLRVKLKDFSPIINNEHLFFSKEEAELTLKGLKTESNECKAN